nr:Ig-like domain repeat protein [Frigoribacterium faeni]
MSVRPAPGVRRTLPRSDPVRRPLPFALSTCALVALVGTLAAPSAQAAGSVESPTFVSGEALDSRVIFQDFSFYQPYESDTYTTLAARAEELADLGVTDVWTAPASRALNAYNEEGYAITDRYDLGEFPAGHGGATATKYGTSDELKAAIAAMHDAGMSVQADIVPNQIYNYQDREVVRVTAVNQWGTPDNPKVVNKLYEVYTKGSAAGQQKYGTFPQWSSADLNGISTQDIGTDRVMLDPAGEPYRYFGADDERNYLPEWLAATDAQRYGEINAIDGYLTVDGYYAVAHDDRGAVWRSLLLGYTENQPGAITQTYLDYMRERGYGGGPDATDDEVRAALVAVTDSEAQNATNDYIGLQPGYSSRSEQGITALRFDDDTSGVNENLIQSEFLLGQDVDNSSAAVQAEHRNWEEFLLDEYGFDGFRFDAAGHYNKEILEQSADLFAERYGDDQLSHLNFIESYVDEQVPFLNGTGNGQLAYDDELHYAYFDALGEGDPSKPLSTVVTNSYKDRTGTGSTDTVIPNWSFVTNHDTEHNDMAKISLTAEQAGGFPYGTKEFQLAQYEIYTADRATVDKQHAPYNVPASYALMLTNQDTVPTVFYGDMWEADASYMTTESPYHDAITALLQMREQNVSGEQTVTLHESNLSSTPGQDLISSVRAGSDRETGVGVVVGNQPDLDTTVEVAMGAEHADQEYVDALGYHGETLTTDADGVLTVPVQGTRTVEVNGYLAAWVPAQPAETSTAVVAAASSITEGETTELAAEVSSQADGATGSVEFLDGAVSLGTAELVDGRAVLTTPADLAVGEHSITAVYSGDERHLGSTSPASVLTVVAAAVPGDPGTTPGGGTAPADGTAPVGGGTSPADGTTPVGGTTPATGSTPAGGTTGLADSGTDAGTASAASPAGSLAFTGAQTAAFVAAAALLLALGAAALVWSRRRRRAL